MVVLGWCVSTTPLAGFIAPQPPDIFALTYINVPVRFSAMSVSFASAGRRSWLCCEARSSEESTSLRIDGHLGLFEIRDELTPLAHTTRQAAVHMFPHRGTRQSRQHRNPHPRKLFSARTVRNDRGRHCHIAFCRYRQRVVSLTSQGRDVSGSPVAALPLMQPAFFG